MAILIMCYKSDLAACRVMGALLDEKCLQGECQGSFDHRSEKSEEIENFGALRFGYVERLIPSRVSKRVTLAIVEDWVSVASVLRRLSQTPDMAIQVMTAHDEQKELFAKLSDASLTAQGYAVFAKKPAPLVDVGSSLLLTNGDHKPSWFKMLANVLVNEIVIPKPPSVPSKPGEVVCVTAPLPDVDHTSLPYG